MTSGTYAYRIPDIDRCQDARASLDERRREDERQARHRHIVEESGRDPRS